MKPIALNQRVLVWLCMLPPEQNASRWKKTAHILFTSSVLATLVGCLVSSIVFVLTYLSINLKESLYAMFPTFACSGLLYVHIVAILSKQNTSVLLNKLLNIYDVAPDQNSLRFLKLASNQSDKFWQIYLKYVLSSFGASTVMISTASVWFCHLWTGHFDVQYLYHPHKLILPWNQSTPLGYSAEITFSIAIDEAYMISNSAPLLLLVSICLHHRAFYKILDHLVCKLNNDEVNQNAQTLLVQMIRFQMQIKDWFWDSAELYSPIILIRLISSMFFLACCIFQLDLQMKHVDFDVVFLVLVASVGITDLFFYCYFGKLAAECYANVAHQFYECNWPELNNKYQKYFIIMIGNAQQPLYYHGFQLAQLNLATFCKMLKSAFTYYMLFKTIAVD